jgi:primosomal protein N'
VPDVKLVTLKCPNCGGNLSVGPSTETFACEYCGANVGVSRDGTTASLHLLSDGLARIQRGTGKAAAERRLQSDLVELDGRIGELETQLKKNRQIADS